MAIFTQTLTSILSKSPSNNKLTSFALIKILSLILNRIDLLKKDVKYFINFSISILLFGCSSESESNELPESKADFELQPTSHSIYLDSRAEQSEYHFQCSDKLKRINDSTIRPVIDLLNIRYVEDFPDFALFDWNGDGYDDLFFEYYAAAGTGVKFRVDVFEFNPKTGKYKAEDYTFMNPAYFCEQKIITSHYLGYGGGWGEKYIVRSDSLELIESVEVNIFDPEVEIDSVVYLYTQTPFQDTIRVTDTLVQLPKEYQYEKIIKN